MSATVMVALDGTIANVALPHMQSAMLASSEQVVWILTSYFIASAIAIPLTGWLAGLVGRKRVMIASIVGFTLASLACGLASNIDQMVVFRLAQDWLRMPLVSAGIPPSDQYLRQGRRPATPR
jgi:DHA2 family multidrug resistance protein